MLSPPSVFVTPFFVRPHLLSPRFLFVPCFVRLVFSPRLFSFRFCVRLRFCFDPRFAHPGFGRPRFLFAPIFVRPQVLPPSFLFAASFSAPGAISPKRAALSSKGFLSRGSIRVPVWKSAFSCSPSQIFGRFQKCSCFGPDGLLLLEALRPATGHVENTRTCKHASPYRENVLTRSGYFQHA